MNFVYPPPSSLLINSLTVVSLVSLANAGLSEARGKHLNYSKFWNVAAQNTAKEPIKLSGRTGMLALYTPAFLSAAASFFVFPNEDLRFLFLKSALALHFFKRIFEVLFIHKYSGGMTLDTVMIISLSYFTSTTSMLYTQQLTQGFTEPEIDVKYVGIICFLIGIAGNFYHHYLLSKLRSASEKGYKIPMGGLFDKVICPHYLFEILVFWGFAFIAQTFSALSFALGTTFYLAGRSVATRRWYVSKFDDFPKHIRALVPYLF